MKRKIKNSQIEYLIKVLLLEPGKDGFYKTSWGKKTRFGLIELIKEVLNGNE